MLLKPIKSVLFKLLARRDHSRHELYLKLKKIGYEESKINETLNEAQKQGFVNDQRLVENYIHYRSEAGYGPYRIESELLQKGIDKETIAEQMPTDAFFEVLCEKIRKKRFGDSVPSDYKAQCKQIRFLQYRGFKLSRLR